MILNSPYITGSITVTGNANIQGTLTVTGSLSGTATSASLALNSNLLQGTGSVGFATTASLLAVSSSQQQISASLLTLTASYTALSSSYTALSGSYNTFSGSASTRFSQIESVYATTGSNSFRANQSITGSLVVSSTITAQTLVVQTVTSSIVYSSGSNIFGSALGDRQTFTGSVNITGSLTVTTTGTEFQVTNAGVKIGNVIGDAHSITGSVNVSGSSTTIGTASFQTSGNNGVINLGGNTYYGQVKVDSNLGGIQINSIWGGANSGIIQLTNGTAGNVRLHIADNGNVGIGVTNPQRQFVIADSSGNGLEISNSSGYSTLLAYNRTTSAYQNIVLGEGTGNVGIGVTNPGYKLQVRPTTGVNMIVTNNGANLQIGSSNDAGNLAIPINFTATSFTFNSATTFSSSVTATGGLFGKSYAQTSSSGSYSVVDTGIYNSVDYSSAAIWLVSYGGNPLAAGSNYFANYFGALSVTTGYIGGSVKQYIQYSAFSSFDASGVGNLSFTPSFWNGTSELTTIPNASTSYQIRIKIGTYNPVGSGQYVYLLRMGQ